jgi:DNA-binding LacI/PurR family transcriptional regulator/DNA-binding transcriptional regulator YhcF (GntR family)
MMQEKSSPRQIIELADRIAEDIRRRELRPGDAYLCTAEVARVMQVNGTKANRALQLLARRRVLDRRQRKGTFIAHPPADPSGPALDRVHLLVQQDYLKTEGLLADGVVLGIQGVLPAATLQFDFSPGGDDGGHADRLIAEALRARRPEGFVLVRSSVQAQRLFRSSGLPTVVYGSLQASIQGMAQVERDQAQIGRLLARHLVEKKCRRVAVLLRDRVWAGDHHLLDAIQAELAAAGFAADGLAIRCLPADAETVKASVHALLEHSPSPLGLVCRTEPLAQAAAAAAAEGKQGRRGKPRIVVCDVYRRDSGVPAFPFIRTTSSPEEIGRELGLLLVQQARGEPVHPARRLISVTLEEPRQGN